MLDAQRHKAHSPTEHRLFARNVVLAHLAAGLAVTGLLVFHELFAISIGVFLWYLLTIVAISGMMNRHEWCRPLLAALFILAALLGVWFITSVHPTLVPERPPMLSRTMLPLWGALANVVYFIGGILVLASSRIRKATMLGFDMW